MAKRILVYPEQEVPESVQQRRNITGSNFGHFCRSPWFILGQQQASATRQSLAVLQLHKECVVALLLVNASFKLTAKF